MLFGAYNKYCFHCLSFLFLFFFFIFIFKSFIEIRLIYSVVIVSSVQHSD